MVLTIIILLVAAALVLSAVMHHVTGGHKMWKTGMVASAITLVLSLGLGGLALSGGSVIPQAAAAGNPSQDLTVSPGDLVPSAAKCSDDAFVDNSLRGVPPRKWADAVSTPFTSSDRDGILKELLAEICQNPTLGDAYAQALNVSVVGDFKVGPANPWLGSFLDQAAKPGLRMSFLTKKTGQGEKIFVTSGYQQDAEFINTLLLRLVNQGVVEGHTSTANWPLGALVAGELPRAHEVTDKDKQESLPFLALAYTVKGGGNCSAFVLGVNTQDKRPEFVSCEVAKKIAPPKPTPGPGPTTPTPTPTTPTPTPTTPTPTPHPCPGGLPLNKNGLCPKIPPSGHAVPPGATGGTVTGPASPSPTVPSNPASTTPPSGITAPGATPTSTTPSTPAPTATNAAPPSAPATGDTNPGPPPQ